MAVAHTILRTCWHLLSTDQPYRDAGPEIVRSLADEALRRRAIRQLQALGYSVTLHELPQPA